MAVVEVGDMIQARLPMYFNQTAEVPLVRGEVFYVHPQERFCRAEFKLPGGCLVKETFLIRADRLVDAEKVLHKRKKRR